MRTLALELAPDNVRVNSVRPASIDTPLWRRGMEAQPDPQLAIAANIKEDNLHNLYLQHLVDTGVQGLVVFLLLAGLAWHRVLVSRFQNPMVLYVGIYFVLALLQFRGAEALLWFVYGLQRGAATLPEEMNAA